MAPKSNNRLRDYCASSDFLHLGQSVGGLLAAHHADLVVRRGEEQPTLESPAAHAVNAGVEAPLHMLVNFGTRLQPCDMIIFAPFRSQRERFARRSICCPSLACRIR
jgi:hypothetical protein